MNDFPFDQWVRRLAEGGLISRRAFGGGMAGALSAIAVMHERELEADAKKKKRKNRKKKKHGLTCPAPYFTCGNECRLQGACCDSDPSRNCAAAHEGEGGNWVCCSHAGYGCFDLDNDALNCGACGHGCDAGEHCLNGTCLN